MGKVVIGQRMLVERLIMGLLANGHVLLEGVPAWPNALDQIARPVHGRRLRAAAVHARHAPG